MEQNLQLYLGKEFAKYFVYCCEGDQYVQMIDQFRRAKTRITLIEAMESLLKYSDPNAKPVETSLTDEDWKRLTDFIQRAEIQEVRELHTMMIRYVSAFELEKIRITEEYLTNLLTHFDEGDK